MPPSKRKSVRRKAIDATKKDPQDETLDSSPSARPSAKKRKLNGLRSTKKDPSPSPELPPAHGEQDQPSDAESEDASTPSLLDSVVASLSVSKDPVFVARDHANELETESVNAFAKIAGKDWTYYMREQTINIGRPPDDKQIANSLTPGASSPIQDLKEQFPVHIDLGPSKIVSRHHAAIYYDDENWVVRVNGRNGVRIDNTLLKRNQKALLHSGTVLEVAGTQMMFVLPNQQPQIHQDFINRARTLFTGEDPMSISDRDTEPELSTKFEDAQADASGFPSIAPAPPNFRRTITPPPADSRYQRNALESKPAPSPAYGRGMMMESTQEIDYSRDSAKDLKPPYSYAHLIAQAIFSSDEEKLTLSQIYNFIADKYAFYRHANSGWQNSIRHNLSLNKAFQKVPRRTDEPGKGMKWQIAPENRQEYLKKISKRGPAASSNPSSPAAAKDVNPNFRGPNGQNLGYDTSMVSSFSAREPAGQRNVAGAHMSFPPYPPIHGAYPAPLAGPPHMSQPTPQLHPATSTPQRSRANTGTTLPDNGAPGLEESPLPSHYPGTVPRRTPFYSLPTSAPHQSPSNPTLSSSYLDTPFQPSHSRDQQNPHLITPAPLRQNPRLAPPSTLVAPSKFMPESSPAAPGGLFWKGFLAGGMTPGAPGSALPPDLSPVKNLASSPIRTRNGVGALASERDVMSSSPPPMDALAGGSPSKPAKERSAPLGTGYVKHEQDSKKSGEDGDSSTDLHKGTGLATSNGNPRLSVGPGAAGLPTANAVKDEKTKQEEDDDDDQGFDLARGFAPISSFSSSQHVGR